MSSILASVDWGAPALRLLAHARSLDPEKPAVLHIRHTERHPIPMGILSRTVLSTSQGKQVATEFGAALPPGRQYRLFHTYMDRTRETAEELQCGILSVGGKAEIAGKIPYITLLEENQDDVEWMKAYMEWAKAFREKYVPEDGGYVWTRRWTAGLMPTTMFRPSGWLARELARITMENLRGASSSAFHIYVSHDNFILALMFHWFAISPHTDGLCFLDGFLMQLSDTGINVWFRDQNRVYEYPYWWPK